jgi:hypothetical protein
MKLAVATFLLALSSGAGRGARFDYVYRDIMMPRPGIAVRLLPQDRAFARVHAPGSIRDLVDLDPLA